MGLPISLELPAARTTPLDRAEGGLARMPKAHRRLAETALGAEGVFLLVRTGSRTDVGGWLRGSRVWAAALAEELALFAWGRRPYSERIPFAQLRGSVYNPVTGELVLAPAEGLRVRRLRMSPLDGYQMLAQIYASHPAAARMTNAE